jgi:nucleosome binding factor SPN SPT16 subunit
MTRLKVEGHSNLERDVRSNGVVNTNTTEYQLYMSRIRAREKQGDAIRNTVKEINDLKKEMYEIKNLLKEVLNK